MDQEEQAAELEELLAYIRSARGFDFSGYKRASLARRMQSRMQRVGVSTYAAYRDLLEADPGEFADLFDTILINVTGFFRDREAWEYLGSRIIPSILDEKRADEPIRAWCVGCSSGEETYTLAMVLAEQLESRGGFDNQRLKIYGTDLDETALSQGRAGTYTADAVEPVPPQLRERYFTESDGRFSVRSELRASIIFGRHNLLQDSPIPNLDLLVCRNILMYFNAEAQTQAVARLHFALQPYAFAFLGRAEMLMAKMPLFEVVSLEHRIFRKLPHQGILDRVRTMARIASMRSGAAPLRPESLPQIAAAKVAAQIVLDEEGKFVMHDEEARRLFALSDEDMGRPFSDMELATKPVGLLRPIEQAHATQSAVWLEGITRPLTDQRTQYFDVIVMPLSGKDEPIRGTSITYLDVTSHHELQLELERTAHDLDTAYEELQSTNEELQTANEELKAANDELETTNHELAATNSDLQEMNRELQSANRALRQGRSDLVRTKAILESMLTSIRFAAIAVDEQLRVLAWNSRAAELWGRNAHDVLGTALLELDIGLPVEQLATVIHSVIKGSGQREIVAQARNAVGASFLVRAQVSPLTVPDRGVAGATILIEELPA